jgi:hypothetical protein
LRNVDAGVAIVDAPGNIIGGSTPQERNIISGGNATGVGIIGSGANGNQIAGNYIGLDVSGTSALGNLFGLNVRDGSTNMIGGTAAGLRNVISGNGFDGVFIESGTSNQVRGNYIGTDAAGTSAVGNGVGARLNGRNDFLEHNVISGNELGVRISFLGAQVRGNLIGTDPTGRTPLGNRTNGVLLNGGSDILGGTDPGEGNLIAFNGGGATFPDQEAGVLVDGGLRHAIRGNQIHSNAGLGIDIRPPGVGANDSGDADNGPNNGQNFPELQAAGSGPGGDGVIISGSLNSTPQTQFAMDFYTNAVCDPSGFGEGERFLGSEIVTTDAGGDVSFSASFTNGVPRGHLITATATDADGNTSEFSACQVVGPPGSAVRIVVEQCKSGLGALPQMNRGIGPCVSQELRRGPENDAAPTTPARVVRGAEPTPSPSPTPTSSPSPTSSPRPTNTATLTPTPTSTATPSPTP